MRGCRTVPPSPADADQLEALGVPGDALVVGNVAALTEHKDHDTMIRAAAQVVERQPRARFVIVGDGELRESLGALAASLGVAEHVVFTGFRKDIDRLMPAFDVFCLSSILEGLGTSLLDAMSFSVPSWPRGPVASRRLSPMAKRACSCRPGTWGSGGVPARAAERHRSWQSLRRRGTSAVRYALHRRPDGGGDIGRLRRAARVATSDPAGRAVARSRSLLRRPPAAAVHAPRRHASRRSPSRP